LNNSSRDFNVLRKYLPEKYEYVVKIYMGDLQKKLYNKYLEIQNIDPTGLFLDSFIEFI
jgi:SNF2 family DNA or RNA helicase